MKEAIQGLLQVRTPESYNKAKKILANRFGNPFSVGEAYMKKIERWPKILPNDGPGLRRFSDFLVSCKTAMDSIRYLEILNSPAENKKMYGKLPTYIVHRWSRVVQRWTTIDEEDEDNYRIQAGKLDSTVHAYPPFSEFCTFLRREADVACNTVETGSADNRSQPEETARKGQ